MIDSKYETLTAVIEIKTSISAENIARRAFGNPNVLREHNVLYSMEIKDIRECINRFPIHSPIAYVMHLLSS